MDTKREMSDPACASNCSYAGNCSCCSCLVSTVCYECAARPWLTHRCGLHKDVLTAQVGAGKGSCHGDKEVEYGDDNSFNRANWRKGRETTVLLGKAWREGPSCNPANGD